MNQSQFGQLAGQQQWQQQPSISERWAKIDDTLQQFIQMFESRHNNTQEAGRRLEEQCRFIIQKLDYLKDNMNPREECTIVVTESGKMALMISYFLGNNGQMAAAEMISGLYDPPEIRHRMSMDEFRARMAWPKDPSHTEGGAAGGAADEDEDLDE
ncbi:hypothetical protein LR48_Vigan11g067900 [Vigna angularis]|uniref:Uncharacterized protein n=1 Tax=Phaseolus angularis TaxID=3914 RepID=A0A0L9VRE6_PHAAN|nr:hypothetical protein LR48_Vigan11g067900 [Vigna angularis]